MHAFSEACIYVFNNVCSSSLDEWLSIGGVRIKLEPPKHPELVPRLYGTDYVCISFLGRC